MADLTARVDPATAEALELITSGDAGTRHDVLCGLRDGAELRAALRAVRRTGPGRWRAAALAALTVVAGPSALDPAGLAAADRLIRIRRAGAPLGYVTSCWLHWWCVPAGDQDDVIATLGLTGVRPATYDLAGAVIDNLMHARGGPQTDVVYVGPATDGWVTLAGPWCDVFYGPRAASARTTVENLSRRYGEAHAFYLGARDGGSGWLVARDGVPVRRFCLDEPEHSAGAPLPIERAWLDARGIPGPPEAHLTEDEFPDDMAEYPTASEVAAEISVDVGWERPAGARLRGGPLLAFPPGITPAPLPPGFYPI